MKNLLFVFCLSVFFANAQTPPVPCGIVFQNGLGCQQSIDLDWEFTDSFSGSCGSGSAVGVPWWGVVPINCSSCTNFPLTDLRISITAMNGCPLASPLTVFWSGISGPGAQTDVYVGGPCPCSSALDCCDNGTYFVLRDGGTGPGISFIN